LLFALIPEAARAEERDMNHPFYGQLVIGEVRRESNPHRGNKPLAIPAAGLLKRTLHRWLRRLRPARVRQS
jgi:hypothetical protein